ncbi:MAG: bacteriohemerythrin, partial [Deltaproteobacteria bacterium]
VEALADGMRRHAFAYLEANLPGISLHDLRMLVNHPITEINPGAIFLKEGEIPQEILLLLSGRVEKIRTSSNFFGSLSAGSLIGDIAMLDNRTSYHTYRADSFVRVLRMPVRLYAEVIRRNGLLNRLRRVADMRAFLNTTSLFSEDLPVAVLAKIIEVAAERRFECGELIGGKDVQVINIIQSGAIERSVVGKAFDVLKKCDFFGEEGAILKVPSLFNLRAVEETLTLQIHGNHLENVPILRWKILENYQQSAASVVHGVNQEETFIWNDSCSIHVAEFDEHHKRLFEIANSIAEELHSGEGRESVVKAMESLVDYTRYHFTAEEKMFEKYCYSGAEMHIKKHSELISIVLEYMDKVLAGDLPDKASFMNFMERWLVRHLLEEDRKYGAFLNEMGVY